MTVVPHAVVFELFEGDEVGPDGAGVLRRPGFLPQESLTSRESERKVELRLADAEGLPFDFGGGKRLGILQNVAAFTGNGGNKFSKGLPLLRSRRG